MNKEFEKIKKTVLKTLKKYDIARAGVFGSYARGEQNKSSDVDILIEVKGRNFSLLDLIHLEIILERELNRKVDLITYDSLNPLIKKKILSEEIRVI